MTCDVDASIGWKLEYMSCESAPIDACGLLVGCLLEVDGRILADSETEREQRVIYDHYYMHITGRRHGSMFSVIFIYI